MYVSVIKNSLFYVLCFYFYRGTNPHLPESQCHNFLSILFSFLLSFVTYFCKCYCIVLSYLLPFTCFVFCILIIERTPSIRVFFSSMLSYGFNLLLSGFLSLVISLLFSSIPVIENEMFLFLMTLIIFGIQFCIIRVVTKNRKHQVASLVISLAQTNTLAMLMCIGFVLYTILEVVSFEYSLSLIFYSLLAPIILILFILWWRSQITKSYREKLRLLEVESLRTSQLEQANYISQLEKENERMGRIIHKDNRIVNAMADSVAEYLKDTTISDEERYSKGVALAEQIESIHTDRQNILLSEDHISPNPISQTGYVGVDALIAYMAKEAAQHRIALHFDLHVEFFESNSLCMSEEDLVHLLSDTLKNAVIATRHNNGKDIKLSMLMLKGIPTIAISDSGIPFSIDTYVSLGLEKASTHIDEGGSGIGLLDIWSLKEKYKATLYIDEHPTTDTFTKQLVFIFDKKNRYMISSNRYKEIQRQQSRADLYLINPATENNL